MQSLNQWVQQQVINGLADLIWREREGFPPTEEMPERSPDFFTDWMPVLVTLNCPITGATQVGVSSRHFTGLTERLLVKFLDSKFGICASAPNSVDLEFSGCKTVRDVVGVFERILMPLCPSELETAVAASDMHAVG